jgi:REP element-mobilizing transposase RayT
MPNHFHLCGQIRSSDELARFFSEKFINKGEDEMKKNLLPDFTLDQLGKKTSKSFSNFFNSYAQCFNNMYERKGNLFMQNIKKQEINDDESFCRAIQYIHTNPIHHGFVNGLLDWPYTSYNTILSDLPTKIDRAYVLDKFGGRDEFIKYHQHPIDLRNQFLDLV